MKWSVLGALVGSALFSAFACGGAETGGGSQVYGGSSGAGPGPGGSAGAAGVGPGGVGGFGPGGLGGAINVDSGQPPTDANPDAPCEGVKQDVITENLPVDIIWAIDNSLSMLTEVTAVQENINTFSQQISAANIDVHVVMLAGPPFCVPTPLGSGQCPGLFPPFGQDSKPPNYFHEPNTIVDSWNAPAMFVQSFPNYKNTLRPKALKYLVVVTDDDSTGITSGAYNGNPTAFINDFTNLDPMLKNPSGGPAWKMSGVYAQSACPNASRVGTVYKAIIDQTGGVHGDICACNDATACTQTFKNVLDSLAKTITTAAKPLDCEYPIPPAPPGKSFDKTLVNVNLTTNGATENIGYVPDASKCHPELGGWYYDNEANPTRVITCPKSCDKIKGTQNGSVAVAFGCKRIDIPIAQ